MRLDNRVERCTCWLERHAHAEGVPTEFKAARWSNYRALAGNAAALKAGRGFLEAKDDLFLCGGVGCGKTRLACTILNEANRAGRPGLFARVTALLYKLQPSSNPEGDQEAAALMLRLTRRPLLVLDDLGAEREQASDFTRRTLLMIYEERFDRGLRTIWTSNLRLEAGAGPRRPTLGEFMKDDRFSSRIAGRARVLWLATPDQRVRRDRESD